MITLYYNMYRNIYYVNDKQLINMMIRESACSRILVPSWSRYLLLVLSLAGHACLSAPLTYNGIMAMSDGFYAAIAI